MKRTNYFCFVVLAMSLSIFSSCKQIDKATTISVSVPDFTVDIPATLSSVNSSSALRAAGDFRDFSGSATIDLSDPNFAELAKYKDMITSVNVGTAVVTMTASTGTAAKNVVTSASGVTPDYTISSYTFGDQFSMPDFVTYTNKVFNQLIKAGSLNVSISGQTDIDDTTGQVIVSIHFGNIEVKAQILNL